MESSGNTTKPTDSATAGSVVNPSFAMPTLGGAIPRIRLSTNDATSTAAASSSVPPVNFYALAVNNNGTAASFNSDTVGMFMAGGPLTPSQVTTTYAAFHTFMRGVAGVP